MQIAIISAAVVAGIFLLSGATPMVAAYGGYYALYGLMLL